jgi:hypothetical protein
MKQEEVNFGKHDNFKLTMIPGAFARKMRTCLIFQAFRFVVSKSH